MLLVTIVQRHPRRLGLNQNVVEWIAVFIAPSTELKERHNASSVLTN